MLVNADSCWCRSNINETCSGKNTVMAEPPLEPQLEKELCRYLHTGMEVPKYFPGCWDSHKYFEVEKLKAIDKAFEKNLNNVEIVNVICKVILEIRI